MKRPYALALPLLAAVCLAAGAPRPATARDAKLAKAKYLDPKVPVDKRVADLLGRMTPEEKIAQLTAYWFPKSGVMTDDQLRPALGNDKLKALLANGLGEISRPSENEDRKKNLNARQEWLLGHVRAGSEQASNAAVGMNDTATGYETEDTAAAGSYDQFGGGSTAGAAPIGMMGVPLSVTAAPAGMPAFDPIPDVSGTDGETLARQLETGAGPGPATTAAASWFGLRFVNYNVTSVNL